MRCAVFCTAEGYDLVSITKHFRSQQYKITSFRDVLHLASSNNHHDIFIFPSGCFVSWGLRRTEECAFAKQLNNFARGILKKNECDFFSYIYGAETKITPHDRLSVDMITLDSDYVQIKLAISIAFAQSIKLENYEDEIQETVNINRSLPDELAKRGRIALSRNAISKRMGMLLRAKSLVNLHSGYLEVPEYFWQHAGFEEYYLLARRYLDIQGRVAVLNQKLDILQDTFDMLNGHLQHRHSSLLEIIIILLIAFEILLSLFERIH